MTIKNNISELFETYGITGIPAIDTIIFALFIPVIITYATLLLEFLRTYLSSYLKDNVKRVYKNFKRKFLGTIDMRLCVSQEKSIYPSIKGLFFSPSVKSDDIDSKTIGILNLITESKYNIDYYYDRHENIHDMSLDSFNNIVIEKRTTLGTSISKKYFKYENYYIVVSENNKTDFTSYYKDYEERFGDTSKNKNKNEEVSNKNKKEYFILFEAIRSSNEIPKDPSIIKRFLCERFEIDVRIPFKYIMKVVNDGLASKLENSNEYLNNDGYAAQLSISDSFYSFINNEKVKEFYGDLMSTKNIIRDGNKKGISSSIVIDHKSNTLDIDRLNQDITIQDNYAMPNLSNMFEDNFTSIVTYFFGSKFAIENMTRYYFYFKNNKIVLYFRIRNASGNAYDKYFCVISFQEILTKENIVNIFTDLMSRNKNTDKEITNNKIKIYTYSEGEWDCVKCDSRSYDTIYLPFVTKKLIMSEMKKIPLF